jgi:hypothetical protein
VAIARGGIAVSGSYQASKRSLNVHLNQADSKSKARSAISQYFCVPKASILNRNFPVKKTLKKISNAKWAKIACSGYEGEERELTGHLCGQLAFQQIPNFSEEQIVED